MSEIVLVNLGVLWVVVLGNLVLTAALIRRVRTKPSVAEAPEGSNLGPFGPETGSVAPDFDATTSEGQKVRLSDYRGKPLMLMIVSPQCTPCQQAVPAMLKLAETMKKKSTEFVIASAGPVDATRKSFPALFERFDAAKLLVGLDVSTVRTYNLPTPGYCAIDGQGRVLAAGVAAAPDSRWPHVEEVFSN
jgi:peroxiredoxin